MAKDKKENKDQLIGCDFCIQFDMDVPHVVAATDSAEGFMEIKITPTMDGGVMFQCPTTGKKLRIFPLLNISKYSFNSLPVLASLALNS